VTLPAHLKDDDLDATFFALASDLRRRMPDPLKREGGCNVNPVCEFLAAELGRHAVMKHLATLENGSLLMSAKDGRDKRLWFGPTPLQRTHERWTTEFRAEGAARLPQLKYRAEGADVRPRQQRSSSPGRKLAGMADRGKTEDAVFRIATRVDVQRDWRELTKRGPVQGAVFNVWPHGTGVPGVGVPLPLPMPMRTGSGRHAIVDGSVEVQEPPCRFVHTHTASRTSTTRSAASAASSRSRAQRANTGR
jgi:hypothetical protein